MSRERLTDTAMVVIKNIPMFEANLDNLFADFNKRCLPRPEDEWTPPIYSGMFICFLNGMINALDQGSTFNSNYQQVSAYDKQRG